MSGKGTWAGLGMGLLGFMVCSRPLPVSAQASLDERTQGSLFEAILEGDTNAALRLLNTDTNLARARGWYTRYPLHLAASKGRLEIVEALLRLGAKVDAIGDTADSSNKQITALEAAVWYGQPGVAKRLLEAGADPNHIGPWAGGPLHMAFTHKRADIATLLLDQGANPFLLNPFPWDNQKSALELAILSGDGHLVPRMLRDRSQAESFLRTNGITMLSAAANRGQIESVQALLEAGVSPKDPPAAQRTLLQSFALAAAAWPGHPDASATNWAQVRNLLRQRGAVYDVFAATGFGDLETVRQLAATNPASAHVTDQFGETTLHWAVRTDRLLLTEFWLAGGAATDVVNLSGQSALHLAAELGLASHVRILLAAKASTKTRDTKGQTPLEAAMQAKRTETIRLLLESDTNAPPVGRGVATSIHDAARSGNIVALTALLTKTNLEARNELGFTPLHVAAQSGQLGAAAFLLDRGADVNATDAEGNTVLHLVLLGRTHWIAGRPSDAWVERKRQDAQKEKFWRVYAAMGEFKSVRHVTASAAFFLGSGADVSRKNKAGKTVLELALDESETRFDDDRMELLPLLSQSGQGVDDRDDSGETALHRAARSYLGDKTEALIAAGADVNATNRRRRTPLHVAAEHLGGWGESQPFSIILKAKPRINARDNEGLTPLHVLLLSDSSFVAEATGALLAAGADPNIRDVQGRTPLLCALAASWPWTAASASVAQLVAAGADVRIADADGSTTLHYLARMGRNQPMLFLRGITNAISPLDVNSTNRFGDTPLHVAVRSGTVDVFDWLRQHGASLDVTNAAGETPRLLVQRNRDPFARFNLGPDEDIFAAAQRGDLAGLRRLLTVAPQLLHATNTMNETVLRVAARNRQTNAADLLVKSGAAWDVVSAVLLDRVNVVRELLLRQPSAATNGLAGKPLLHVAAEAGSLSVMELLLSAGAEVNGRAISGLSPLGAARLKQQAAAADWLRARGGKENLFDAVFLDQMDLALAVLARDRAAAREECVAGLTVVHLAVALNREAMLQTLLEHGESASFKSGAMGVTPLHVAAYGNRSNAVAILFSHGAVADTSDADGSAPLHYAAFMGAAEVVEQLLQRGVKPDLAVTGGPDTRAGPPRRLPPGTTALHLAAYMGDLKIIQRLIAAGAKLNALDAAGMTTLDRALARHNPAMAGFKDYTPWAMPGEALRRALLACEVAEVGRGIPFYRGRGNNQAAVDLLYQAGAKLARQLSEGATK